MTINHRELLRAASRTFALSIERLPGLVGEAMCLAYLLLRVSDFLEDNDYMPPERKVTLLRLWDNILAGQADPHDLVAQGAKEGDRPGGDVQVRQELHATADVRCPASQAPKRAAWWTSSFSSSGYSRTMSSAT